MGDEISARCDAIEKCYEFMLAYAGQGLGGDEGSASSGQVRDHLERAAEAISGLSDAYTAAAKQGKSGLAEPYRAFLAVLERDARDSLAAIQVVLAQRSISSQLIDNLNASIHLRALLTDLFLIDEVLRPRQTQEKPATAE
jgi:hypothetical protein